MLCGFKFSMYRYCKNMYMSGWRRESKTLSKLHGSILSSIWVHFIRFWHHVQTDTSASVFPFVYNIIVFYSLFQGTSLFVHTLAVMSQFVQWGMMCFWEWFFFQVKLLIWQDFQVIQKYPSFHYFCLKIGFALLYFRWLGVWSHILIYFIVANIYVNGFQPAWK